MSTFGAPSKYSYFVAENEAGNPWEPLHVERGFPAEATTVTVIGAECPHNVNDHESLTAEGILTTIAGTMATTGNNDIFYPAQPLVVFGPEHAKTVADGGYSKAEAKRFLAGARHAAARQVFEGEHRAALPRAFKERYGDASLETPVPMVQRPEEHDHRGDRRRRQAFGRHSDFRRDAVRDAGAQALGRRLAAAVKSSNADNEGKEVTEGNHRCPSIP